MKKLVLLAVAALAAAPAALGANPKTVYVRHRDPGCHWFLGTGGKYLSQLTMRGPVRFVSQDIAVVKIVAHGRVVASLKPGKSVILRKGSYTARMVGQEADDNTLHLTVR